jgi:hypothetical protein
VFDGEIDLQSEKVPSFILAAEQLRILGIQDSSQHRQRCDQSLLHPDGMSNLNLKRPAIAESKACCFSGLAPSKVDKLPQNEALEYDHSEIGDLVKSNGFEYGDDTTKNYQFMIPSNSPLTSYKNGFQTSFEKYVNDAKLYSLQTSSEHTRFLNCKIKTTDGWKCNLRNLNESKQADARKYIRLNHVEQKSMKCQY